MTADDDTFQLDAICSRFDAEWSESAEPPDLGSYLTEVNEASRDQLFPMLLAIDVEHRRNRSLECDAAFYAARFPEYNREINAIFAYGQTVSLNMESSADDGLGDTVAMHSSGTDPSVGTKVKYFGDYELLEKIAQGGMGVVYKARQTSLNRIVALKMILSGELATEKDVQRFKSEAEAAAKLDHPGIVPIFEIGEHNGQHYFSMGFVDGQSLADRLRDGPLPPREAAELLTKICDAVEYAHGKGVVHRDLKPGNVLIDEGGKPRVTDFGLAKQVDADSELTKAGQVLGTPSYMPPEQASGDLDAVGKHSDVYSLGAILYCLLTGRPPFQAAMAVDTVLQVLNQEPVALRTLNPQLPGDLDTICLKCLNKESNKRYEFASELSADLRRYLAGEPILARRTTRTEKAWKWCKRNPVITASGSLICLLLIVMGLVYSRFQGRAAVETLLTADATTVLEAADKATTYRFWTEDELQRAAASNAETRDEKRRQRHARLALVPFDSSHVDSLLDDAMTTGDTDYVGVIREALLKVNASIEGDCWSRFHNGELSSRERFRAGVMLAGLVPQSGKWTGPDFELLVDELAALNSVYQPQFWPLLQGVADRMMPPLEALFNNRERRESEQLAAANAIAFFADQDAQRLARLLLIASGPQYNSLFEKYREVADGQTKATLAASTQRQPTDDLDAESRIALGKERADSAITLLRLGERELILDVLRYTSDAEALTQFVHRCRARGVTPAELIKLLEIVDQRRGPLDGDRQKIDDSVMYALLLALGEFAWNDLSPTRDTLVERLGAIYEKDPSSGVHSATGWLLRKWNQREAVDRVDQTTLVYDATGHREWYVSKIVCKSLGFGATPTEPVPMVTTDLHLTLIVFQPGEFTMGSPDNEPIRQLDETQHQITFTQPLAVCDRELTWTQWMAMEGTGRRDAYVRQFSKKLGDNDPVFGVDWFDAVRYCRWLSKQAGLSEDKQCYEDPSSLPKDGEGNPTNWPLRLERAGFRLPTEAEWEFVCRSGTGTAYSCGHDVELLDYYAWSLKNSAEWMHATGQLRPNPRGLFDIHGNLFEWCHDWYNEGELSNATDPTGAETGPKPPVRVTRGGCSLDSTLYCRSSLRHKYNPSSRSSDQGFRLATTLSRQRPSAEDQLTDKEETGE